MLEIEARRKPVILDLDAEERASLLTTLTARRKALLDIWHEKPLTLPQLKENATIGKLQREIFHAP